MEEKSTTKGERMWECECGTLYAQEEKECPICNSKKRKKSKTKNFSPVTLERGDKIAVSWNGTEIPVGTKEKVECEHELNIVEEDWMSEGVMAKAECQKCKVKFEGLLIKK